jgi:hypothetical protein
MNEETTFYTTVYYVGLFKNGELCQLLSGPYVNYEVAQNWQTSYNRIYTTIGCDARVVEQVIELHL